MEQEQCQEYFQVGDIIREVGSHTKVNKYILKWPNFNLRVQKSGKILILNSSIMKQALAFRLFQSIICRNISNTHYFNLTLFGGVNEVEYCKSKVSQKVGIEF